MVLHTTRRRGRGIGVGDDAREVVLDRGAANESRAADALDLQHAVGGEQCGGVVEPSTVREVRVRGDRLSNGVHATDATCLRRHLDADGGAQHVVEGTLDAYTRRAVVAVEANGWLQRLSDGPRRGDDLDVLQRLVREHVQLERCAVATLIGMRRQCLGAKGAPHLFGTRVLGHAQQGACASAVHGPPRP